MWMRSATSKTCGMLWLIRTIGRPLPLHVEDQLQHLARFLDAERRRRLVHDDDPAAEGGGAHHGHALALAAGERLDRLVDVLDGHQAERVELLRAPPSASSAGRAVRNQSPEEARLAPLAAEEQVVGDRERRRQREVLVDGLDARPCAPPCGERKCTTSPSRRISPWSGSDGAGERLDQRRLAGAVVADHGQDLARHQVEIGMVERRDAAVALDEAAGLQDGRLLETGWRMADGALMPTPSGSTGRSRRRR